MKKNVISAVSVFTVVLCLFSVACGRPSRPLIRKDDSSGYMYEEPAPDSGKVYSDPIEVFSDDILPAIDGRFYYDQLGEKSRTVYNQLYEGCLSFKDKINISADDNDYVYQAQYALSYDHPEFFWIKSFTIHTTNSKPVAVSYDVPSDCENVYNKIDVFTDSIVAAANEATTLYGRIRYIYEYIINITDYDPYSEYNQDIRSVFLNHASVCSGYARAFQYLCHKIGVECAYVDGIAGGGSHAWNILQMYGNYYWVDVTWGDPVFENRNENNMTYDYFMVSDAVIDQTHTLNRSIRYTNYEARDFFTFPQCNDDSYNYYVINGMYFTSYNRTEMKDYILSKMRQGQKENIIIKFSDFYSYDAAVQDLLIGEYIADILRNYYGSRGFRWEYIYSDSGFRIDLSVYDN